MIVHNLSDFPHLITCCAQKLLSFPSVRILQYTVSCVWDTLRCDEKYLQHVVPHFMHIDTVCSVDIVEYVFPSF
jgi:hypothetical protein